MEEVIGDKVEFIDATWVDTFSTVVVITGFSAGLLHILILFYMDFHKYSMTRVLLGQALCIFVVAVCRICMLLSAKFNYFWGDTLTNWCYVWKAAEIWALGMSNAGSAIMSLVYFRLVRKAWFFDLRLYHIGRDRIAWCMFALLFLCGSVSTGICMSYAKGFLVNRSYCLAVGWNHEENGLHSLWLALCICLPSLVAIVCFSAGAIYFAMLIHRCRDRGLFISSSGGLGSALSHLNNIQTALQYLIISWLVTNSLEIFWVIYYPQSNTSRADKEYYISSVQLTTIQNLTDFLVNLNFFILPRMGYTKGINGFVFSCWKACTIFGGEAYVEKLPKSSTVMRSGKRLYSEVSLSSESNMRLDFNEPMANTSSSFE